MDASRPREDTRGNELSGYPYIFCKYFSGLNACQRIVGFCVHKFFVLVFGTSYLMPGDAAFGRRIVVGMSLARNSSLTLH